MVDDALEAADRILQNRGPGDLPHRWHDRTVHNRAVEAPAFGGAGAAAGMAAATPAAPPGAAAPRGDAGSEDTIVRDHSSLPGRPLSHRLDCAPYVGVGHDDGGLALQRVEVAALKAFAGFRCGQQLLDLIDERGGIRVSRRRIWFGGLDRCARSSSDSEWSQANHGSLITSCSSVAFDRTRPRSIS